MTAARQPVLVIGDACVDLLIRLPDRGGDPPDTPDPMLSRGGTGANTAVALARLNVPAAFMGTVGDDGYGRFVRRDLVTEGIDTTSLIVQHNTPTAVVLVIVDRHGERTLVGWPRRGAAHTALRPLQVSERVIERASWVHTTGMCLVEPPSRNAVLRGMALARTARIPVSLDLNLRGGIVRGALPGDVAETFWAAIALADYVLGSLNDEFAYLSSEGSGSADETVRLVADGKRVVIARAGAASATVISAGRRETVPAFQVPVVNTVGAGDAFNAGFIAARLAGRTSAEAARWGNAVAALKISRPSGGGVPAQSEVEAFLREGRARASSPRHPFPEHGAPP